jgi:pyruvate dehydrogenase E2 component (dihydrolipoamide acetyltransferase)
MAEVVPMPKLGFDMAEGTLVRKLKQVGESVTKGEIIAEIETDKATVEVEAYLGGVVKGWVVTEGQAVPVGSPMVVIAEPGEEVDIEKLTGAKPAAASGAATPAPQAAAPAAGAPTPAASLPEGRVLASPIAKKMAETEGVNLAAVSGTGPGGRVVKRDVQAALGKGEARIAPPAAAPTKAAAPASAPAFQPISVSTEDKIIPLTKLRNIIAKRMVESTTTVPVIYLTLDVDMAAAVNLRKQINSLLPEERKVSVNDLVIKAVALALRQFPNLNASFGGDKIVQKGHVNVGNAVALPTGLLTVVVKDADVKPLAQIGAEMKAMVARAREGKVQPGDIEGSTFTVSNLGMYEIEHFTAIINLPEAGILAVGAAKEVPVVKAGQIVPGTRMRMTCAADHRVTDGAEVAQYLQAIKKALEEPLRLLV